MANRAALIRQENEGLPVVRKGRRFLEFALPDGKTRHVATIEPLHTRTMQDEIDTTFVPDTGAWQWKLAQATDGDEWWRLILGWHRDYMDGTIWAWGHSGFLRRVT